MFDDLDNAKELFSLKGDKSINHIEDNNSMENQIKEKQIRSEMKNKIDALFAIEEIKKNEGFF